MNQASVELSVVPVLPATGGPTSPAAGTRAPQHHLLEDVGLLGGLSRGEHDPALGCDRQRQGGSVGRGHLGMISIGAW